MAKRQPNFSAEEVEVLVGQVEKRSKVLFGGFGGTGGLSSAAKDKAWEEVGNIVSAVSGVKRSVGEVKKKWAVLKSSAKGKAAANARQRVTTGGGPPMEIELTATDGRIVGMLSSVAVSGLACGFDSADDMLSSRK